jgi:hypothetical protein
MRPARLRQLKREPERLLEQIATKAVSSDPFTLRSGRNRAITSVGNLSNSRQKPDSTTSCRAAVTSSAGARSTFSQRRPRSQVKTWKRRGRSCFFSGVARPISYRRNGRWSRSPGSQHNAERHKKSVVPAIFPSRQALVLTPHDDNACLLT